MAYPRLFPRRSRLLAVSFSLVGGIRLAAAAVVVDVTPSGVSVQVPAGMGAAGTAAAPAQPMILPTADFARNLSFQLDRIVPAPTAAPLPTQLRGALQTQVLAGTPRGQAVATQRILVQALSDPELLASIQENLRRTATPGNPALGRESAEKLAGLAAAAGGARSRQALRGYADELTGALAASLHGDDVEFDRLFDGLLSRKDAAAAVPADAPAAGEAGTVGSGKILMPLTRPTTRPVGPLAGGDAKIPAPASNAAEQSPLSRLIGAFNGLYQKLASSWRGGSLPPSIGELVNEGKMRPMPSGPAARMPRGWRAFVHGTNFSLRQWHDADAHKLFSADDAIMVVDGNGTPPGLSVNPAESDGGLLSSAGYAGKIGDYPADAAAIELRVLVPGPASFDQYPQEIRDELKGYLAPVKLMGHMTVPAGTRLIKIGRSMENGKNVFTFIPDYLAFDYFKSTGQRPPTSVPSIPQAEILARLGENQALMRLRTALTLRAGPRGISLADAAKDIQALRDAPSRRQNILARYGLSIDAYFPQQPRSRE